MALTEDAVRRIVREEIGAIASELAESLNPLLEMPEYGDVAPVLIALFGIDKESGAA